MKKRQYGEVKNVIAATLGCHYDIKQVILVDEDISIDSPGPIEWAVATRIQANIDLVVINRVLGSKLDPSGKNLGLISKIGLDAATYPDMQELFMSVKCRAKSNWI
ncbi:UbiD family decarboxylase domain-containing protein [Legionella fallonii]|uniref:3-octaprenyl-4-hydroxybenzoate carboxy-lyase-like C-terminal domain-containing protein n=1 Tax=Legionella fallonii LLAP-10 TaxID=1212491 RepID=A0A098G845_9GAMM|nr:UbiD family decarboxylase domain-containing protein [Legionella fallonii]CEG58653.1 protein of unknown function [Legionella fallonii LLAP-10]